MYGSHVGSRAVSKNRGEGRIERRLAWGLLMLVDVMSLVLVGMACWFIYWLSPGFGDAELRSPLVRGTSLPAMRDSWPRRRRYLLARMLRMPTRHLASVVEARGRFEACCVCGWHGGKHAHQGDAFAAAHVHTRYVDAVLRSTDQK